MFTAHHPSAKGPSDHTEPIIGIMYFVHKQIMAICQLSLITSNFTND
jgi:hypothetical protein